ncbi:MAG: hypothetical protein ACLR0W_10365 [Lachnospira sp.]
MGDYYEEDKYYLIIRSTGLFNGLPVMVVRKRLIIRQRNRRKA